MRSPGSILLTLFTALPLLGSPAAWAQIHNATTELSSDRWQYPYNFTPGTRQNGPLFVLDATDSQSFNARDGMVILKWLVTRPPELTGDLEVTSASLRFWDRKQANYVIGSLSPSGILQRIELYAARFDTPYSEASWQGTEPYIGAGVGSATTAIERNPYPIDHLTGGHVENNLLTAVPWAVGEPVGYTPGQMNDSFPIDFHLDVHDAVIQNELQQDLLSGSSSWFISATFELNSQDASATPQVLMSEAAGNASFGTSHQAPSLTIQVREKASAVDAWDLHE
jgi:hypothetical protein